MISADFEDMRAGGAITRNGSKFTLARPADREEAALLEFFASNSASISASVESFLLLDRLKWGDVTLFRVANQHKLKEDVTFSVRCAQVCTGSFSMDGYAGVPDPEFVLSTFAYFRENHARLATGELARARSFPLTLKVLPENLAPTSPYPITFRVDVRLAFATNTRPAVYDFASRSWHGKPGTNEAEWQGLVHLLEGLRKATPNHVADYLNQAFAEPSAEHFLYSLNTFELRNGALSVTSPLLEPDDFAARVADFKSVVPLGTVQDGPALRLLFATSANLDDVQQMPIRCGKSGCHVVPDDWVSYVNLVIQQPGLLRLYLPMFRKTASGGGAQK